MLHTDQVSRVSRFDLRTDRLQQVLRAPRRVWRPVDGFSDLDVQNICRNERCSKLFVHPPHDDIEDSARQQRKRGWVADPLEKERWTKISIDCSTNKQPSRFSKEENIREIPRPPSHRGCPRGVDNAIALAVSSVRIKIISEIHQDVLDRVGSVEDRTVYRRLAQLVRRGCIIRVSFQHHDIIPMYSSCPRRGADRGIVLEKIRGCVHPATKADRCPTCSKPTWKDDPPRGTLSGYLRPTSRLFTDPCGMKDQLWEACSGQGSLGNHAL